MDSDYIFRVLSPEGPSPSPWDPSDSPPKPGLESRDSSLESYITGTHQVTPKLAWMAISTFLLYAC